MAVPFTPTKGTSRVHRTGSHPANRVSAENPSSHRNSYVLSQYGKIRKRKKVFAKRVMRIHNGHMRGEK